MFSPGRHTLRGQPSAGSQQARRRSGTARPFGEPALEDRIKAYIKTRDGKPGAVFLGVVHRIDRPVSGAVLFAKTSKALTRLNEMIRTGEIRKIYWAVTEQRPDPEQGS